MKSGASSYFLLRHAAPFYFSRVRGSLEISQPNKLLFREVKEKLFVCFFTDCLWNISLLLHVRGSCEDAPRTNLAGGLRDCLYCDISHRKSERGKRFYINHDTLTSVHMHDTISAVLCFIVCWLEAGQTRRVGGILSSAVHLHDSRDEKKKRLNELCLAAEASLECT